MRVFLGDGLVPEEEARVSVFDHGFLYGDGVYETMRAYGGKVFLMERHLLRLKRSADMIGLGLPRDEAGIGEAVRETLAANGLQEASIRVTVSRGPGPLGLDPALCREPTFLVMARPFKPYPEEYYREGVRVVVPRVRRNLKEALDPRIKSLNFLNNILAKREALQAGAFEALMLNHRGELTECTVSNVFFLRDGRLCTPAVDCGLLDGITRGLVLELARGEGIPVEEGVFREEDIHGAEEVFLTNTSMEAMPVGQVGQRAYPVGETTLLLRRRYAEYRLSRD
ncbi:MAG: aminotransferase class IV [Nitrospirota bacterium]|jgi:branched-chain amino acid aminotransferase